MLLASSALFAPVLSGKKAKAQTNSPQANINYKAAFLAANTTSSIYSIEDIRDGHRICGGAPALQFFQNKFKISGVIYRQIPLAEFYMALSVGVCDALVIVSNTANSTQELADRLFPKSHYNLRIINLK